MIKFVIVSLIKIAKRLIFKLNDIENKASCNKQVINKGSNFISGAKVINMQKNPERISLGYDSYIKGELLLFKYGGMITIGNCCYVGDGTRIWSGESISIGNNVLISHNVNIMDTTSHELNYKERAASYVTIVKDGHPSGKGSIITAPVIIEDDVWINFNVTILKGVTIGRGAIIGAGSVVTKDIPQFTLVGGNPARVLKHLEYKEEIN